MAEPVIELLAEEWGRLDELCASLSEVEWATPTDCPGWTVVDQLAHVIGTESMLAGRDTPTADEAVLNAPHVRNDIGRFNEAWVASLRPCSPVEVLATFRTLTTERLDQLRSYPAERFDEEGPSPVGRVPYRDFMAVRAMDTWVHEQDIRRAVGRPGHRSGPVVEVALQRFTAAMPFVVGKGASAPEGSSVLFRLHGDSGRDLALAVTDGRARLVAAPPTRPTVTLAMTTETWWCLGLGRWDGARARTEGVVIEGDRTLGDRIVDHLAFMV